MQKELISGIKEIDTLTEFIHDKKTPQHIIPYLSELRDYKIMKGESSYNYEGTLQNLIYERENHAQPPEVLFEVKVFEVNLDYTLELGIWSHPVFKDTIFYFVYVKDKHTGKKYFTHSLEFYRDMVFDEKDNLINNTERKMYATPKHLVSVTVYGWYNISRSGYNVGKRFYDTIMDEWEEKISGHKLTRGKEILRHNFRQLNFKF